MTTKTSTAAVIDVPATRPADVKSDTSLITSEAALPMLNGAAMATAVRAYRDLQKALDAEMPDQIMNLDGKPFRKKGYRRALAVAFNLKVEPIEEIREIFGKLPDGAENYGYTITYRAATKSGREAFGDGTCTASEKFKGKLKPTEHNVRSHAHTRAYNRAISNLVAFGEVSAEEAEKDDEPQPRQQTSRPTPPALQKPDGYDAWHDTLIAAADGGEASLQKLWGETPGEKGFRRYITTTD